MAPACAGADARGERQQALPVRPRSRQQPTRKRSPYSCRLSADIAAIPSAVAERPLRPAATAHMIAIMVMLGAMRKKKKSGYPQRRTILREARPRCAMLAARESAKAYQSDVQRPHVLSVPHGSQRVSAPASVHAHADTTLNVPKSTERRCCPRLPPMSRFPQIIPRLLNI